MKSFYLQEKCNHCNSDLYVYKDEKFKVDCSNCNKFKEIEFNSLREVKKKFNLKLKNL